MEALLKRYPALEREKENLQAALEQWLRCYEQGGKLLICGNGGSCADSEHIVGELMKGFLSKRPLTEAQKAAMNANCPDLPEEWLCELQRGLPAVSLTSFSALNTAFANDVNPALMFAQAVLALGKPGDVLVAISTSGNSANVCAAAQVGKAVGLTTVGLAGNNGGKLKEICDVCICAPETETYKVQEYHLPIYHYLCAACEKHFFG